MDTTAELRAMSERLAGIDPSRLGARDAEDLVAAATTLTNAASALAGRAARRVGATDAFRRTGDRTEAHHLARVAGVGLGAAKTAIDVTRATDTLESTRSQLAQGALSMRQAEAICGAALVDRRSEARLLRLAKSRSITQLEAECARVRAAAAPDDEAQRHRRARSERGCWRRDNRDGSAEIRFRSSSDDVAEAWASIAAFRDRLLHQPTPSPTDERERPSFDQLAADALLDVCRAAASGRAAGAEAHSEPELPLDGLPVPRPAPVPSKIVVRIDWDALMRGHPIEGEVSEIPGVGPVPVAVVRDLIDSGDPFLAAVVTKGTDVATVAHLGRRPSTHQQTALQWLNPRCRAEGCDRTVGLEVDHRVPWAEAKITLLSLLDWLCTHHHRLKTHHSWNLVDGHGIRAFVPPDDPRHPTRAGPRASEPSSAA